MRKGYILFDNYLNILKQLGVYGYEMLISLGIALYNNLFGKLYGILVFHAVNGRLIDIRSKLWKNVEIILIRKLDAIYYYSLGEV